MGELTDKIKAAGNKIAGEVKEAIGKSTNDDKLTAEGQGQQVKGAGQDLKGSIKGAFGDNV